MNEHLSGLLREVRRRLPQSSRPLESIPEVAGMTRSIENGRCLYEGYQRSVPLMYGSLGDMVWRDPVFRRARAASRIPAVRSMIDLERLISLFLIVKFFLGRLDSQNIIEFGSFRGGGAVFMATLLAEFYPQARILSLDTFGGIPASAPGVDKPPQQFEDVNLARIRATAAELGLKNLEFVQGLVQDTALDACRKLGKVGLAHVDVVLHEPSTFAQDVVWDFFVPGGYLIQDDALEPTCPGATMALEELICKREISIEQVWPHVVLRAGLPA